MNTIFKFLSLFGSLFSLVALVNSSAQTICIQPKDQIFLPITLFPVYVDPGALQDHYQGEYLFSPQSALDKIHDPIQAPTTLVFKPLINLSIRIHIFGVSQQFHFPSIDFQTIDDQKYMSIVLHARQPSPDLNRVYISIQRDQQFFSYHNQALEILVTKKVSECLKP